MNTEQALLQETLYLDERQNALVILDQTQLPEKEIYLPLKRQDEIWNAIYSLQVRGAPAIGVAAAYGLYLAAKSIQADSFQAFYTQLKNARDYLASSRPTAVNLFWALDRMEQAALRSQQKPLDEVVRLLLKEAHAIRQEDTDCCRSIGEFGLSLLRPRMGILTHCNAGRLAATAYGTATAPLYLGQQKGYAFHVYADETRPLLQGARLTAYELQRAGVDVTLICDNMAASMMQAGKIQAVLVGCDRVAANGDTANKIGTCGVAILADYFHILFYVCAPSSTIDLSCPSGKEIPVEQRPGSEITELWYRHPMAPAHSKTCNPAFDVTPASLVSAFITEKGILRPPYPQSLKNVKRP